MKQDQPLYSCSFKYRNKPSFNFFTIDASPKQCIYVGVQVQHKGEWEEKESVVRELYGLEFVDPNVTFALCCGTRSSPAVSSSAQ